MASLSDYRGPRNVIQTNPLPPGRKLLARSATVMPDEMDAIVGEVPLYDHKASQEANLALWIEYSARRRMAIQIGEIADRRLRSDAQRENSG